MESAAERERISEAERRGREGRGKLVGWGGETSGRPGRVCFGRAVINHLCQD